MSAAHVVVGDRLAKANPDNATRRSGLAATHNQIAALLFDQGDFDGALAAYRQALTQRLHLAEADPKNNGRQRSLSLAYDNVAKTLKAQDDLAGALEAYEASLAIAERLAKAEPGNAGYQSDLAFSYRAVGDVRLAQGDLPGALAVFQKNLALSEALAEAERDDSDRQRNLSLAYDGVAKVLEAQGDLPGALAAYEKSLVIAERLAKAEPEKTSLQRDLYISYDRVGTVLREQGRLAEALAAFRQALAAAKTVAAMTVAANGKDEEVSRSAVSDRIESIGGMAYHFLLARDFAAALEAADESIALAPDTVWFYSNRAHALMLLGREDEARALYLKYRGTHNAQGETSWSDLILVDFVAMRETGIDHPLMGEIERALGPAGAFAPGATQAEHAGR